MGKIAVIERTKRFPSQTFDKKPIVEKSFEDLNKKCEEYKISFDIERANLVVKKIINSYEKKERIFSRKGLFPEAIFPEGMLPNTVEYANYLFFMNQLDHNIVSQQHYKFGRKFFSNHSELLQPNSLNYLSNLSLEEIKNILKNDLHYPFVEKSANNLAANFKWLKKKFDGDPTKIFDGIKDVSEALEKLQTFKGYGPNLSSLLLTYYIKYGFLNFENHLYLLPKIDLHDIRITIATGIMHFEKKIHKEVLVPILRAFYSDFCNKYNFNIIKLDDALWAIGSNICNKRDNYVCYTDCPVDDYCKNLPYAYYKDGYIDIRTDVKSKQLPLKLR